MFWAFSNEQFEENKTHKDVPNNEYLRVSIFGNGSFIHYSNKEKLDNFIKNVAPKLKKEYLKKINIDDLIEYELTNHECYYTGDIEEVVDIIEYYYKLSKKECFDKVQSIYLNNIKKQNNKSDIGI